MFDNVQLESLRICRRLGKDHSSNTNEWFAHIRGWLVTKLIMNIKNVHSTRISLILILAILTLLVAAVWNVQQPEYAGLSTVTLSTLTGSACSCGHETPCDTFFDCNGGYRIKWGTTSQKCDGPTTSGGICTESSGSPCWCLEEYPKSGCNGTSVDTYGGGWWECSFTP